VLSLRGVLGGLGLKPARRTGGSRVTHLLRSATLAPFVSAQLLDLLENPIKFQPPHGARSAFGYPATIIADICEVVLPARSAGGLDPHHEPIADRCEILVRGFGRVGIIALIDEATGFQHDRAANALARMLEAFIDKELQPWVKTFPTDYYRELFRLRGLDYPSDRVRRPQ
jgi:hypothetical protein